jgi:hypothetical protein
MKKITILISIFLLFSINLLAQTKKIKINNKKQFIETVKYLEKNPLAEDAKAKMSAAMQYSEKVNTLECDKVGLLFLENPVAGEVIGQYMIALALFSVENPKSKNVKTAQFSALESALKVYQIVLQKKEESRTKRLDLLVLKSKNGELK